MNINVMLVGETGEDHLILSQPLLEGACLRPKNLFYYENVHDVIDLGVRLFEAVSANHCFGQGNKRTAFHAALVFIEMNEIHLDLPDWESTAELATNVVTGDAHPDRLVDLFRSRIM